METLAQRLDKEQNELLTFLKGRFNLFHLSNVFFRDIHYGVMAYLEMKDLKTPYARAEKVTREIVDALQQKGILRAIDNQTFTLIYPEFKKPAVKPALSAPAKPTAPAAAKPVPTVSSGPASAAKPA